MHPTWPLKQLTGAKPISASPPPPTTIPTTCYDREYLFQFSEMDANIHNQALAQVTRSKATVLHRAAAIGCSLEVPTEPYHPTYFMINGRSMPDDMDPNYDTPYPHQPYNGNPHMHPGEQVLLRIIGQGRWQHPFHEHANHVRILARDGNLILTPDQCRGTGRRSACSPPRPRPGQTMDGIFYFTGRGLNWDMYAHHPELIYRSQCHPACTPDANGYNTGAPTRDQLLRVVPGPQQAAGSASGWRRWLGRSGYAAQSDSF